MDLALGSHGTDVHSILPCQDGCVDVLESRASLTHCGAIQPMLNSDRGVHHRHSVMHETKETRR